MQSWQVVLIVLSAVVVGAGLPALIQLSATLRTARKLLTTSGQRLDRALEEVTEAASRIGHVAAELEDTPERIDALLTAGSELAGSLQVFSDRVRLASAIGAAIAPTVAAAVHAFRAPGTADGRSNGRHEAEEEIDHG